MLKRADRIKRERLRHKRQNKNNIKKLQASMAASSFFVLCMGQIAGGTYGAFTNTEYHSDQLNACEVFPASLEKMFINAKESAVSLAELQQKADSYKVKDTNFNIKEPSSGANSHQIRQIADTFNSTISQIHKEIDHNQSEAKALTEAWTNLKTILNQFAAQINEIQFNKYYDPNCLEIDNPSSLNQFSASLQKLALLDPDMRQSIVTLSREIRDMKHYSSSSLPELSGSVQFSGDRLISQSKSEDVQTRIDAFSEKIDQLNNMAEQLKERQSELYKLADRKQAEEEEKKRLEEEKKRIEEEKRLEKEKKEQEEKAKAEKENEMEPSEPAEETSETVEEEVKTEPVDQPADGATEPEETEIQEETVTEEKTTEEAEPEQETTVEADPEAVKEEMPEEEPVDEPVEDGAE